MQRDPDQRFRETGHAPNAKLRTEIIPSAPVNASDTSADHADAPPPSAPARISWAWLLKRVFDIDLEHCPSVVAS